MDEPFYYLRAEDRVPRDAAHVIVGGSITVVRPGAFRGYQNLARLELREGVEEIGMGAFAHCPNLALVDCPSSVHTIDDCAFYGCKKLFDLILREGLRRIGEYAFSGCDLRRIAVPSSVVEIGEQAFAQCRRLSEAILREGLQRIGTGVFGSCALKRIAIPSSVVEIGVGAFAWCGRLSEVTLAGGMVLVARRAFFNCRRLKRFVIPSIAIAIKAGEDGDARAAAVTREIERKPSLWVELEDGVVGINEDEEPEPAHLILTSCYLASMSQEDRTKFTDAINQITDDQTQGARPLDLGDDGVADSIRDCFTNCLEEYKTGVAAVLELALWKANVNRRREATQARAAGGGKRARVDAPTRDDCRRTCGADVVIGPVLSYLWGPHRRAPR